LLPAASIDAGLSESAGSGACAQRASGAQSRQASDPGADPRSVCRITLKNVTFLFDVAGNLS
jgi:hypothetical protein